MTRSAFPLALSLGAACVAAQTGAPAKAPAAPSAKPAYVQMADSVMARDPDAKTIDSPARPAWNYTQGLVLKAVLAVHDRTGDKKYLDYVLGYYDYFINDDGTIKTYDVNEYSVDRINAGKVLFALHQKTGNEPSLGVSRN